MTNFGDHEGLNLARMWDMGANTQVDHGATAIDCGGGTIRDLGFNEVLLVFVVLKGWRQNHRFTVGESSAYLEHLQECFLGHYDSLELLLLLDSTFRELLENWIVGVGDGASVYRHFVEETVVRGRTNAQVAPVVLLCRFAEDVGR